MSMTFGKTFRWFTVKFLVCRTLAFLIRDRVTRLFMRPEARQQASIGFLADAGYLGDPQRREMLQRCGV